MKGQILKKSEILIRLKEIFDLTKLDAKLTQEQADLIECNMQMQNILLSCKSVGILRKSVGWDLAKTKTSSFGITHRLYDNFVLPSNGYISYHYFSCFCSFHFSLFSFSSSSICF